MLKKYLPKRESTHENVRSCPSNENSELGRASCRGCQICNQAISCLIEIFAQVLKFK